MLVLGSGIAVSAALCVAPTALWIHLFGEAFAAAGQYNIPSLLAIYALATVIYSLGAVIITFEMSYKITSTSWSQLLFSVVLIVAICRYHSSLLEVVLVQLVLMMILVALVAVPFIISSLTDPKEMRQGYAPIRLVRRVSEDAAIAEFLKSDFGSPVFREYQKSLCRLVRSPNLDDTEENATRRALLLFRHLHLWREIPLGTEWFEAELDASDLGNIRMFPRAQWRKVANGRFSSTEVAAAMRTRKHLLDSAFVAKIHAIRERLERNDISFGAVLLIGVNDNEPLTILDGNHRVIAAMLGPPGNLRKLRFLCGLSPRMSECCWYRTNLVTLFRYGKNVLTLSRRNATAELARLLQDAS
jgi:hypothetical protein